MYYFKIPIGDWSHDGHGQKEIFLIKSNKPVEHVRELYFQACDKIGFSLDGSYKKTSSTPCCEYEDITFSKETLQELLDFGVKLKKETIDIIEQEEVIEEKLSLCEIILAFIRTQDSTLEISIEEEKNVPMFQFYGFDSKKRHIGYFGYGLFS